MIKYSYYCDRCGKEINNTNIEASDLKITTEREFQPHSNLAEKFIDRWCMDSMLLCSDCTHTVIYLLQNSDDIMIVSRSKKIEEG